MIIAIDGPAASGKGTLARRIAEHYGLRHLDTGLLYRGTAAALIKAGRPVDDENAAEQAARELDVTGFDRVALADHEVGEAASKVAAMPKVRAMLLQRQRDFAAEPPGAVLDGRDIGTVVCPDADVKLFVVASAEVRARRRTDEMIGRGKAADYDTILEDLKRRDERDTGRAVAPLKPAEDALLLDTSEFDIETAFRAAVDLIDGARNGE
ncbi:MAG: (d)CMP kinase [Hyphomicrobiales bacterium]|nr:MAG: (d)CMP kinase [Hyphomicrobiales bacterium]